MKIQIVRTVNEGIKVFYPGGEAFLEVDFYDMCDCPDVESPNDSECDNYDMHIMCEEEKIDCGSDIADKCQVEIRNTPLRIKKWVEEIELKRKE